MADVSEISPDESLAGANVFNIEEVLVAWGRAGDSGRQNEPIQQFRDSFIVALVGDSAPSSPVGWPLRLDLRDDFESASEVTKAQWRHAKRMKYAKSAKEMNTHVADMKGHPDDGSRWENIDDIYDESPPAHDNDSVLQTGTSPSTEFTHVSPTQVVQDVAETPQVQLRGGSVRATLLQTNSFKRERGGEVALQDLKSEPDTDHGDSTDDEWHNT